MSINTDAVIMSWKEIEEIVECAYKSIKYDGIPDVIIAIQRGGFIPSVMLSHLLNVRYIIPLNVKITVDDTIGSRKMQPILERQPLMRKIKDKNVLIVDDIVGSGKTYQKVCEYLNRFHPNSIRSFICVVNSDNWYKENNMQPERIISYIGKKVSGWVKFPWERYGDYE